MIRPRKHRSNAPATETEHAERWWERAACKDADETLFYLHGNAAAWETDTGREQAAEARAICAGCPVALICRTEAVEQRDGDTFRGGMTPQERRLWQRREHIGGVRPPTPRKKSMVPIPEELHGTRRGYQRHMSRGEPACEPCLTANYDYKAEHLRRKEAAS